MSKVSLGRGWVAAGGGAFVVIAALAMFFAVDHPRLESRRNFTHLKETGTSLARNAQVQSAFAALPLAFEENVGQTGPQVKYVARGNGYTLRLAAHDVTFRLHHRGGDSEVRRMIANRRIGPSAVKRMLQQRNRRDSKTAVAEVRMRISGASAESSLVADDPLAARLNYIVGKDPTKCSSNIPLFKRVAYRGVYPGIDLIFHGGGRQLEFDYVVGAGADVGQISSSFDGAQSLAVDPQGNLIVNTAAGPLEIHKPAAYQKTSLGRHAIDASFKILGSNSVSFAIGLYDHSRELVIDPTVTYSTYFGGDFADYGLGIAVDSSGNEYVAGATDSDTVPGDSSGTDAGSFDVFVSKISPSGQLQFTTLIGGSGDDFAGGIAVDSAGVYVSGTTDSPDFPVTAGAAQTTFEGGIASGNNDAFALNLSLDGSALNWATYIAGSDSDSGLAIAVDGSHNVYVAGETYSNDLGGVTGGINALPNGSSVNLGSGSGDDDGYIVKLNSAGSTYALVSYLGGSNGDLATGVALDGSGNIYVSGETISTDLPVTAGVVQSQCGTDGTCNTAGGNPQDDAFVVGIKEDLSNYSYFTYYGGSGVDDAQAIVADSAGNAFFTGNTSSTDFPTAGTPFQSSLASGATQNAFAVELNPTGTSATYGTYLGGNGSDVGLGIALDPTDDLYLTGQTSSSNFPTTNSTQSSFGGSTDAFVTVLKLNQTASPFSTFLGGGGDEDQLNGAIALDSGLNTYVTGDTTSGNDSTAPFPTANALDGTYGGGSCTSGVNTVPCPDAFVTAYSTPTAPDFSIVAGALNPSTVNAGGTATSTITVSAFNGYNSGVSVTCSVSGGNSSAPTCSLNPTSVPAGGGTSTLTITTTGTSSQLPSHAGRFFYALWLPIGGLIFVGAGVGSHSRRRKMFWLGLLGMVAVGLLFLPACGGSSNNNGGGGGGGGCSGCTPAGSYTVTITGTGSDAGKTTHSTTVNLTVN